MISPTESMNELVISSEMSFQVEELRCDKSPQKVRDCIGRDAQREDVGSRTL